MVYNEIAAALIQSLIDLNLGVPIDYENVDFDPAQDGGDKFLSASVLFGNVEALDKNQLDETRGLFQIGIYTKTGSSTKTTWDLLSQLESFYKFNTKLTNGSQEVVVIRFDTAPSVNDGGWYVTNVTINFKTDIAR